MVLEDMLLWRIFEPRKYEVRRASRKLHNDEFDNLYFSQRTIRMIKSHYETGRSCSTNRNDMNIYGILMGKTEGKGTNGKAKV